MMRSDSGITRGQGRWKGRFRGLMLLLGAGAARSVPRAGASGPGLSDSLCKWPLHQAGTRSGNASAPLPRHPSPRPTAPPAAKNPLTFLSVD